MLTILEKPATKQINSIVQITVLNINLCDDDIYTAHKTFNGFVEFKFWKIRRLSSPFPFRKKYQNTILVIFLRLCLQVFWFLFSFQYCPIWKSSKKKRNFDPWIQPSVYSKKIYFVFTRSQSDHRENLCSQVVLVNGVKAKVTCNAED